MTCILTTVSQAIVDTIETSRLAGGFTIGDFITDWDFEGRVKDVELTDNRVHVRVVVPRRWDVARRVDRGTTLEYIAAWDIDIRQKLGVVAQGADSDIERDRIRDLVALVEEIHLLMHTSLPTDDTFDLQWLAEYNDSTKQSEILVAYSTKYLRENRHFYGVCREVFQVTS